MMTSISDLILPLKPALPPDLYDRAKRDMDLREARLNSEKAQLVHKLDTITKDYAILDKNHRQLREDHGNLLMRENDLKTSLTESQLDCATLKVNYDAVTRLRAENERLLSGVRLEVKVLRDKCEGLEKEKRESDEVVRKNEKLKRDYDLVLDSASNRFRDFEKRVAELERNVADLTDFFPTHGAQRVSNTCVKEQPESYKTDGNLEGLVGMQSVYETTPLEENSASSTPGPRGVSSAHVKEQLVLEGLKSDAKPEALARDHSKHEETLVGEKTASSQPFVRKHSSASIPIYDISDSDEEDECKDECKGLKRKLVFSEASNQREPGLTASKRVLKEPMPESNHLSVSAVSLGCKTDADISSQPKKPPMSTLKQCELKVKEDLGVNCSGFDSHIDTVGKSGNSSKQWDFEADMVDDLGKDAILCMKAVCALYKQYFSPRGLSAASYGRGCGGFSGINAVSMTVLGKFLLDGNVEGELKKSLADLEAFDPKGVSKCRKIAIDHSRALFEIYMKREDPHFAP